MTTLDRREGAPPRSLVPPVLRARVSARVLTPVTLVLLLVTGVSVLVRLRGVDIPMPVQLIPFAVSVLVFGLPHGALDHLVPARLRPGTPVLRSVAVVVALYLVVGIATASVWALAPLLGFVLFIAITWFHWGQGDLFIDRLLGTGTHGRVGAALTVAIRGALPMLVPFIAQPAAALSVVTGTTAAIGGESGSNGSALTVPVGVRVAVGILVGALGAVQLVALRRAGTPLRRPLTEVVVLVVFFAVVPPVLAVGLYFTLWHSVRHILRLELTDETAAAQLRHGKLLAPFLRFTVQAWPVTAIAVGMLVVLALVLRRADLGVYLALLAALTTPHAVVVTWMDHVQRTW